eukprot:2217463-Pyramimonas_sp.AAC.1
MPASARRRPRRRSGSPATPAPCPALGSSPVFHRHTTLLPTALLIIRRRRLLATMLDTLCEVSILDLRLLHIS